MGYFLSVIGMVMIVEGLPYFAVPDKMKKIVEKLLEIEDWPLRCFGVFLMGFGLFLVYLGKA